MVSDKNNFFVHQYTEAALSVWKRFKPKTIYINMKCVNKFYGSPLCLVDGWDNNFYFFNGFQAVDQVLMLENDSDYPCLMTLESIKDIQQLAWMEVVKLMFLKDTHHPDLFKVFRSTELCYQICRQ